MLKIPKRFQLGPHDVKVHIVTSKEMAKVNDAIAAIDGEEKDESPPWGLWIRGENAIFIQKVRVGFNQSQQLHTFFHELTHAIFSLLNESDLNENERLVDQCGLMLHQFHQTAKY